MDTEFAHITLEELKEDWLQSHQDVLNLEAAIKAGVTHIFNGTRSLQERVDKNKAIIGVIEKEMKDRLLTIDWVAPTTALIWTIDPIRPFGKE